MGENLGEQANESVMWREVCYAIVPLAQVVNADPMSRSQ